MPNRREFDQILGRIITNKAFGDRFMRNPAEAMRARGFHLSEDELARLSNLKPMDVWQMRLSLGVQ